ncbi:MAG: polysaccharide biosynthesis protein [Parcubacteria group bacterium Gr01-1014_30]|nr:MAG: polysaccharide biosynthesis protein [Parcubacteria group bacterium Gr01-1014_30]
MIAGKIALLLISFVLMVGFANLLPRETYGKYQYLIAIISVLSIFTLPGIHTSMVKSIAQGKEGTMSLAMREKLKWGLLGSFFALLLAIWYSLRGNQALGAVFLLGAFFLPLLESFQIYLYFWNGRKRFDVQTKYEVFSAAMVALALLIALYISNDLLIIVSAFLLSHTFVDWLLYRKTLKHVANDEQDQRAISFGKHLTVMGVLSVAATHIDKLLLWKFLGAAEVAIYAFAQLPIHRIVTAIPITSLALPKLGKQNIKEKKPDIMKKFYKLFFVFLPLALLLALAAPLIYKILLPQYLESVIYFQALSLMIALAPFSFLNAALIADMRQKDLYVINTASPFLKIALFFALIPFFGIWGVTASLLISQIFISCLTLFYFRKL